MEKSLSVAEDHLQDVLEKKTTHHHDVVLESELCPDCICSTGR